MIKVSTRGRYGARALLELARHYEEGYIPAREVAEESGIPLKYLEQIFVVLKRAGIVTAARGPEGGYRLSMRPEELTLFQVVEALEGPLGMVKCADDPLACDRSGACALHGVWKGFAAQTESYLKERTYAQLLGRPEEKPRDSKATQGDDL